jgi:hypothetical protein
MTGRSSSWLAFFAWLVLAGSVTALGTRLAGAAELGVVLFLLIVLVFAWSLVVALWGAQDRRR